MDPGVCVQIWQVCIVVTGLLEVLLIVYGILTLLIFCLFVLPFCSFLLLLTFFSCSLPHAGFVLALDSWQLDITPYLNPSTVRLNNSIRTGLVALVFCIRPSNRAFLKVTRLTGHVIIRSHPLPCFLRRMCLSYPYRARYSTLVLCLWWTRALFKHEFLVPKECQWHYYSNRQRLRSPVQPRCNALRRSIRDFDPLAGSSSCCHVDHAVCLP